MSETNANRQCAAKGNGAGHRAPVCGRPTKKNVRIVVQFFKFYFYFPFSSLDNSLAASSRGAALFRSFKLQFVSRFTERQMLSCTQVVDNSARCAWAWSLRHSLALDAGRVEQRNE